MPEIKDEESLKAWLETRPQEDAIVIASRAALRALPGMATQFESDLTHDPYALILPVFRASAVARVAGNGPTQRQKLQETALSAARSADSAAAEARSADSAAHAALSAAYSAAAAHAALSADSSAAAAHAAALSARSSAAASSAAASSAAAWNAVERDAEKLEKDTEYAEVLVSQLWPKDPPGELAENWTALRDKLLEHDESWRVWTDWYQDRLDGKPIDEVLEIEKALIPGQDWDKGPAHVNAIIGEMIDKYFATLPAAARDFRALESQTSELKSDLDKLKGWISETEKKTTDALTTIGNFGDAATKLRELQSGLKTTKSETEALRGRLNSFDEEFASLKSKLEKEIADTVQRREQLDDIYAEKTAQNHSVKLWKKKEEEHAGRRDDAGRLFQWGLAAAGALVLTLLLILTLGGTWLDVLFPDGKIGGRTVLATGAVLTLFTLLLWFVRLQMKIFLAERHMAQDARERIAFSEVYLTLLKSETAKLSDQDLTPEERQKVTEDAAEQKSLVYAALFRPTQDGIVKEDAGLDPALSAALSKVLTK